MEGKAVSFRGHAECDGGGTPEWGSLERVLISNSKCLVGHMGILFKCGLDL